MKGTLVSVNFACQATRCDCEVEVEGRMFTRTEGSAVYEYSVATACPKCGHRLLGLHRRMGERPITPEP